MAQGSFFIFMKTSIKFKAITLRGKIVYITHELDVPDFIPIKEDIDAFMRNIQGSDSWSKERIKSFKKGMSSTYTISQQIDDYVSEIDKSDFMAENDLECIIDWRVISNKSKKIKPIDKQKKQDAEIMDFINTYLIDENEVIRADFEAAYTVMRNNLVGVPLNQKVEIILTSIKMAGSSVVSFINRLNEQERKFKEGNGERKKLKSKEYLEMYGFSNSDIN